MAKKGEFFINIQMEGLKRGIRQVAESKIEEIQQAVQDTAFAAHASIISQAQSRLNRTRKDYLKGLKFEVLSPNNYIIYLDGKWPNAIEDGWTPYDMKEKLLKSQSVVKEGSRTGQPWVQKSKKGGRYAHVPFEHKITKGAAGVSDLAGVIKNLKAYNKKTGKTQKLTSTFKDELGRPLSGRVASVGAEEIGIPELGLRIPNLEGITKYQKVITNKEGKSRVKSAYFTFRTVSDNSPPDKWRHPGFQGLGAFEEADAYVEREIQNILDTILK